MLDAPLVIITHRSERAKQLADELSVWLGPNRVVSVFPEPDPLFYERIAWSAETAAARLGVLATLSGRSPIVVSSIRALMQRTMPPADFRAGVRELRQGAEGKELTEMASWLVALGYEHVPVVDTPASFSRRGGIVDIWTPSSPRPVRIEFEGDQVASLRAFDPVTQRSAEELEAITIVPASEALPGRGPDVAKATEAWDLSLCHPIAASTFKQDRDALQNGQRFRGIEFYLPYLYPNAASLLDYLVENSWLVVENWGEIESTAQSLEFQAEDVRGDLEARREIPPGIALPYFGWGALQEKMKGHPRLLLDYSSPGESIHLPFVPGPRYGGQMRKALDEILKQRNEQARVVVVTRQAERISGHLRDRDIHIKPVSKITQPPQPGHIILVQGALAEGWKLQVVNWRSEAAGQKLDVRESTLGIEPDSKLEVQSPTSDFSERSGDPAHSAGQLPISSLQLLTDAELFGWSRPKPRRIAKSRGMAPEAFFADLAIGDYIVHIDHGIGIFRGLVRLALNGPEREFLLLEYAQGDRLYVPVHQIDRLSRYVAPGGHAPTLHRLGTAEWAQVKERTRRAVEDIADELLELYAAREVVSGYAFQADTTWQHELEASFPYVETEDQLNAIDDIKADMERSRPMDRLVVGDVGYGKTEVALRAAFKAATDGKQVAVLVPTTVLAQQHFNTFKERLAPFPIEVEMLSRFRSEKEQRDIVQRIQAGLVDIVIGTHRLLSEDVRFKDLGLLIIDEEQRFGVVHKEKLKQLRQEVDVLTLTATPIPRTLYLSLSGARDMSTIETAPEDRLPIRTYVAEYDERLVRDAILRELDRGGQVFFVHNRVRGIRIIAEQLRKLVPDANIAVGHGQMPEEELEQVMVDFAAGRYDVLVCTTIIESGIDIPNANTLIVNHADKFGLAQLYQLRGRVGRSAARAYAYFLYSKGQPLSEEARARLQSIAEASELGAGFQIAMRDMEIRGAGEILGSRQHGHIAAVGFDLYCRLLANAIDTARDRAQGSPAETMKAERVTPATRLASPLIDLPLQAQIPETYVPESGLRLRLYRRLADVTTRAQVDDMMRELEDRFGPAPDPVKNLIYLLRLKVEAAHAHVSGINTEDGRIVIKFGEPNSGLAARLSARFNGRVRVSRDRVWLASTEDDPEWQQHLMDVIDALTPRQGEQAHSDGA